MEIIIIKKIADNYNVLGLNQIKSFRIAVDSISMQRNRANHPSYMDEEINTNNSKLYGDSTNS